MGRRIVESERGIRQVAEQLLEARRPGFVPNDYKGPDPWTPEGEAAVRAHAIGEWNRGLPKGAHVTHEQVVEHHRRFGGMNMTGWGSASDEAKRGAIVLNHFEVVAGAGRIPLERWADHQRALGHPERVAKLQPHHMRHLSHYALQMNAHKAHAQKKHGAVRVFRNEAKRRGRPRLVEASWTERVQALREAAGPAKWTHRKHSTVPHAHLHYVEGVPPGARRREIGMSVREGVSGEHAVRVLGRERGGGAPINHGREYLGHAANHEQASKLIGQRHVLETLSSMLR
jgi:hypothetical protein